MTAVGEVTITRPYYDCPVCRAGHSPRDGQLGLTTGDLSRGAAELAALAGTLGSFAEAATKTLPKLAGLRISESTVERTTERVGDHVGERLSAGDTFGPDRPWDWSRDADAKTCAYVSADLTGVGMQGPNGAKADGRMAAVGMVWNAGNDGQVRYVCGLTGGLSALGEPLRRQAGQVGMDRADRWIAISDGGSGIEDWLRAHFPRVEAVILDFYHAAEHLSEWAKALHPDADEAARVATTWCHQLKHEGGAEVLAGLRAMEVSARSTAVQEAHRQVLVFFGNQVHRMDYPTYRSKRWLIGSGPVEAACKPVVGQRLKGTGMRWSEGGADAVGHLRALFRSETGQWDAYWASLAASYLPTRKTLTRQIAELPGPLHARADSVSLASRIDSYITNEAVAA